MIAEIAEKALDVLKFYDETRYLTDALARTMKHFQNANAKEMNCAKFNQNLQHST
jgi:hypothetical protein